MPEARSRECRTGKRGYPGQLGAFMAIAEMRAKERPGHLRSYRCNHCRCWHLTSVPLRMPAHGPWPNAPAGLA